MPTMSEAPTGQWITLAFHPDELEPAVKPGRVEDLGIYGELFVIAMQHFGVTISDNERQARHDRGQAEARRKLAAGDEMAGSAIFGRFRCEGHLALVQWPAGVDLLLYDLDEHAIVRTYPYPWGQPRG
jgi:hypothetical protein